jgi:hypothetical protein
MKNLLADPVIRNAVAQNHLVDNMCAMHAERILPRKKWVEMSSNDRKACIRYLVNQAVSEKDLEAEFAKMGCTNLMIRWTELHPNGEVKTMMQTIARASGGMVSKSGAIVLIATEDGIF